MKQYCSNGGRSSLRRYVEAMCINLSTLQWGLQSFLASRSNEKTLDIQKSRGPRWSKLVHQLPKVITFAYNIRFSNMISRWKGIFEKYTLCHQNLTSTIFLLWQDKKTLFRAPKRPSKYIKMYCHENFQNSPFGIGGRPPIYT